MSKNVTGKLQRAKGFKKSRTGMYVSIASSLFGVVSTVKRGKQARAEGDTLQLLDVAVSAAGIVTGIALLVRELRRLDIDDVLADD
jgi:NADH:ubiquinone oxidoreductase subunit K